MSERILFFADTGGTFTDCIALFPDGKTARKKVLSTGSLRARVKGIVKENIILTDQNWSLQRDIFKSYKLLDREHREISVVCFFNPGTCEMGLNENLKGKLQSGDMIEISAGEEAPVLGARLITQTPLDEMLPPMEVKIGSTRGTNALLEKKGSPVVLFVTSGFEDLLVIGTQQRPDIFARNVVRPEPLYAAVIGVQERISASGEILEPIHTNALTNEIDRLVSRGVESAAISLLNAYSNPVHEQKMAALLKEKGFRYVTTGVEMSPMIRYLPRTQTTVVNAYLSGVIKDYLQGITDSFAQASIHVMTSAGGLVKAEKFMPRDSLLSGPAGGVVGAAAKGIEAGFRKLITFDMGGTSTDVSRYDNRYDYTFELEVGQAKVLSPALFVETVAAGGGSICYFDGYTLRVGPESAGASPGPACYGAGGPLTITDVNLLLGHLDPGAFGIPVFPECANRKLNTLLDEMEKATGTRPVAEHILTDFLRIANEIMAGAIRKISVARGYDPADYTLVAFGGAGGMHMLSIADELNISRVITPSDAGLLSAYGLGTAPLERFAGKQILSRYQDCKDSLEQLFQEIENDARRQLAEEGIALRDMIIRERYAFMRFTGQESSLEIPLHSISGLLKDFETRYKAVFGYVGKPESVEVESIRVVASTKCPAKTAGKDTLFHHTPQPHHQIKAWSGETWKDIPVYFREKLKPGARIHGFALMLDPYSTSVIEEGWEMTLDTQKTALFVRSKKHNKDSSRAHTSAAEMELFINRFTFIARNMGSMLQRTSISVNVKERLDFSCALLNPKGELVVNAPHIPVHLGSLGVCIRRVAEEFPMQPGDTIVTNHPRYGGSHLPDITLITPVYTDAKQLTGYVVSRAHHAEIGGIAPGSMPPDAKRLSEEGITIPPFYLVKRGRVNWDAMRAILQQGKYPSRNVGENLADLNAALAANRSGEEALKKMCGQFGIRRVTGFMDRIREHAAAKMRETLRGIPDGTYESEEFLDDGTRLRARITIRGDRCDIDFSGTDPVHPGNMNATEAIVNGVIVYVLRLLVDQPVPLNDGFFEPVTVHLPGCLLNPPFPDDPEKCPAIVGGNVEVSQRLTDTLLKPFNVLACSQGTMNNVIFGNKKFSYYETVCGGCGAGPGFNGASAVHHHMTNTRITDPEIMEFRYPVRLMRFAVRIGSGGTGKWHGGDGVVREILFLNPLRLSVLTQHRKVAPYGSEGGYSGVTGRQVIIRKDGTRQILGSVDGIDVSAGDILVIETPGGGGYGHPDV
ncbi:MAG: 5-oxoprolinase [Chlorobi bacterium]|nr:5-oxoprolinase [Chlorobiota bacterium]